MIKFQFAKIIDVREPVETPTTTAQVLLFEL